MIAVLDEEPDHDAHRGVPSLAYVLTQRRRLAQGWSALAGNHIFLAAPGGEVVALCHLQRGSVGVRVGQYVRAGEPIERCGNSGNSTEPHLHLQREAPAGRLGRRWPHQRRPESFVGRPGAGHLDR